MRRLFISYATPQREQAEAIASDLDGSFKPFFDLDDIHSGDHVPVAIMNAISTCDAAVIVAGPDASSRPWVNAEIDHMRKCWSDFESRIFVVLVAGATRTDVPPRIRAYRHLEWSGSQDSVALIRGIQHAIRRRRRRRAARASMVATPVVLLGGLAGSGLLDRPHLASEELPKEPTSMAAPPPASATDQTIELVHETAGAPEFDGGTRQENESLAEGHEEAREETCHTDEECGSDSTCIRSTPRRTEALARATKPIELSSKTLVVGPRRCPSGWRRGTRPVVRASGPSVRCDARWYTDDPHECEVHIVLTGPVYDEAKCGISTVLTGPRPARGRCSS